MNPEKIHVEVPGQLGWREYRLRELVWLWRTAQLPHDAVFQNDDGEWRPIDELVDPVIERETKAVATAGIASAPAQDPRQPSHRRRWMWAGLGVLMIAAALGAWPILRDRYAAWKIAQQEERAALQWERRGRMEDLIKSGEVVPGMTVEEVRRSWGEPKVKKAAGDQVRQQWIYRQQTVIFDNGVVTAIEATPSRRK